MKHTHTLAQGSIPFLRSQWDEGTPHRCASWQALTVFLGGPPWARGIPGRSREESSDVEGSPRGQGGRCTPCCAGMLPAVLSLLSLLQDPQQEGLEPLPANSDNDFVQGTAFCPDETLWERETVLLLFTDIDNSSVPIHLLR